MHLWRHGGMDTEVTLLELNLWARDLLKSMLWGVLMGALWTVERAYRQGVRRDDWCLYCSEGVQEDEDHLQRWCELWKTAGFFTETWHVKSR